jgi:hypothetical protein
MIMDRLPKKNRLVSKTKQIFKRVANRLPTGVHSALHSMPESRVRSNISSMAMERKPFGSDPSTYTPSNLLQKKKMIGQNLSGVRKMSS